MDVPEDPTIPFPCPSCRYETRELLSRLDLDEPLVCGKCGTSFIIDAAARALTVEVRRLTEIIRDERFA